MKTINWTGASEGDLRRLEIIQGVCRHSPGLVEWLFLADRPEMFARSTTILAKSGEFSTGQQVLIAVACDIWFNEGRASIFDIARRLDDNNFRAVIEGLVAFRNL